MAAPIIYNGYKVPYKCRHVLDALKGRLGKTEFVADNGGKWRYIDLIQITGRNSSERKLREMIESCHGMVGQDTVAGRDSSFKVFWLVPVVCGVARFTTVGGGDGVLFEMPQKGRPE